MANGSSSNCTRTLKFTVLAGIQLFFNLSLLPAQGSLTVACQSSGPFHENSFLVYGSSTGEAAWIDPGSEIDQLLRIAEGQKLNIVYILLTHAHQDHMAGVAAVLKKYPHAKLYLSRKEYEDIPKYTDWKELFSRADVVRWENDSAVHRLMDIDFSPLKKPVFYKKDQQSLKLGEVLITVWYTPGHSRGSVTLSIGSYLFPGDLILYQSTGYLDYPLCSRHELATSVRRLYAIFPDGTILYSGHGQPSTVGFEKMNNKDVTWDNSL